MSIKTLRTGLPTIGYLKIGQPGMPRSDGKQSAPEKFDHVEVTRTERDQNGRLVPDEGLLRRLVEHEQITLCGGCARSKALGFPDGLPTRIPIQILYNDLELTFPHRLAWYRGRTAYCVGDGETAQRLSVKGQSNGKDVFGPAKPHAPCGDACPEFMSRRCKPHGRFRFMLGVQESLGGCYEFRTTSWNSIANVLESLRMIQAATGGILEWIPLFFEVTRQTVQPKDGAPANVATIARVVFPGTPQKLLAAVKETLALKAPVIREIRQLEAQIERGWVETPEEVAAVVAEFGSEADDAPPPPPREEVGTDDGRTIDVSAEEPQPEPEPAAKPVPHAPQNSEAPKAAAPRRAAATASAPAQNGNAEGWHEGLF